MIPGGGIKVARVFGIDILVNPSWILIFLLVGVSIADILPDLRVEGHANFPGGQWPWVFGFGMALVFFACLLLHELAHSLVAIRRGVRIRRITLFVFGGVAEMAEDVADARTELLMAIAGPLITFVLAGAFYAVYRVLASDPSRGSLWLVPLWLLAVLNLFVGVFNLLPGFPLDGGRILRAILWMITRDLRKATRAASISGQVVALGIGGWGIYTLTIGDAYIGGIWLLLIAVFVFLIARASYRQTLNRLALADTKVGDLMQGCVPTVDEHTTLTVLRTNYFGAYRLPAFPVLDGAGRFLGLVGRDDLASVNPSEWDVLDAGRLARPPGEGQVVGPDTRLDTVLPRARRSDDFLLVMSEGRVIGMLTGEELMRYIDARIKAQK